MINLRQLAGYAAVVLGNGSLLAAGASWPDVPVCLALLTIGLGLQLVALGLLFGDQND